MLRNQVKSDKARTIWNLFLYNFWPLVPDFYFWKGDWALGFASYYFCDFPNIS